MDEKIKALICVIHCSLEDNRFEKEDLLAHFLSLPALLTKVFPNNKNLPKAIIFIQNVLSYYISESELEYQFYSKALNYLNTVLEDQQFRDESVLYAINEQIDNMEELFISRTLSTASIINYFKSLIESNILTDKNYYIANYANRIDDEEKLRILGIIPGVENGI